MSFKSRPSLTMLNSTYTLLHADGTRIEEFLIAEVICFMVPLEPEKLAWLSQWLESSNSRFTSSTLTQKISQRRVLLSFSNVYLENALCCWKISMRLV